MYAEAIADGLNWEKDYAQMLDCVYNSSYLIYRIQVAWANLGNWTDPNGGQRDFWGDIVNEAEVYEFLLAIGNISWQYKDCWMQADFSMNRANNWRNQFNDTTTYLIYLIPNLLAQAVVLNIYIGRIQTYQANNDEAGVLYIWSLIIRKIFIYTMPSNDDELNAMMQQNQQ